MRLLIAAAVAHAVAAAGPAPAQAQAFTVQPPAYDPAPWWMREPVIVSPGQVRAEVRANRASFGAAFEVVDRSVADATRQAGERVRALAQALGADGPEAVRVETTFATRPLYAQYRDKDGNLQTNERDDKIDRYAVTATVRLEVRDVARLERAYAAVIAARPSSVQPVYFRLEPDNALNDAMFAEAVKDAARRARSAAADAGARLGAVRLIDPTGRACQTDVLVAGAPRSYGAPGQPTDVSDVVVTAVRRAQSLERADLPPPPMAAPPAAAPSVGSAAGGEPVLLPLQPPLETLQREACEVYALGG